jgi:site-specific recombinase XerD
MSEIINNLKDLESETLDNFKNSKAANTMRAYKSDFAHFKKFCNDYKLPYLPTTPKVITLYITNISKLNKYSTIKRRISSIKIMHSYKGFHVDVKHPLIIENIIGIKKKIGIYQNSKKPLLINNLFNIIDSLNSIKVKNNLLNCRNKAILLLGFSGGFRRSELVNILKKDVEFVNEGMKISLRKSKTDQFGEGQIKGIPYYKDHKYCPVIAVNDWLQVSKNNDERLFPYSDKLVSLIVKKSMNLINLNSDLYSGHSLRSGFATSTASAGADERSIMQMTGHRSTEMVRRYIKEANLFKNNALNHL